MAFGKKHGLVQKHERVYARNSQFAPFIKTCFLLRVHGMPRRRL